VARERRWFSRMRAREDGFNAGDWDSVLDFGRMVVVGDMGMLKWAVGGGGVRSCGCW
jgi:hypothetical protein